MTRSILGLAFCVAACGGGNIGSGLDPDASGAGDDGSTPDASCPDGDGDGVTTCAGDCDDGDPLNHPGANEICGDAADNDCDMQVDEGCTAGIGTFVSALTGSDMNPGTQAMPVQTIGQGIANALTIGGPQSVIVAEGLYAEKVTIVEGVDLLGGYQCDTTTCAWARDPAQHEARINNVDYEGVLAGTGVTTATLIEGFTIQGLDGVPPSPPGSAAILLAGGAPTIRGNKIYGGSVTGGGFAANRSAGIVLQSTNGARIERNEIVGGASVELSVAVLFDSWPAGGTALATVIGNSLRGGAGRRSVGLVSWNSAAGTLVQDNTISGGASDGGPSHGIEVGSAMTIDGNRINVGASGASCINTNQWCAGIFSESSTTTITNNVVFGPSGTRAAGVFLGEFEIPAGAVVLNGNFLAGGGAATGVSTGESGAVVVSIGTCMTCGFNGFVGRVRNNILDPGVSPTRYGILEAPSSGRTMRPEAIEHNLFWFSAPSSNPGILYRQMSAAGTPTDHTMLGTLNGMMTPAASGNLIGDPMLDASWHIGVGSPCINAGTATEAPASDFEGDARPSGGGIEIGHDETP